MPGILAITQSPASSSLAQSPIIFSVIQNDNNMLLSSSFQYLADLTYWTGSQANSGSVDYTLAKFPNTSDYGIFDVSKIVNSTLTERLEENSSNAVWFKAEFYPQYIPIGTTAFVTGSRVSSRIYAALDGYGLFPENITSSLQDKTTYYPILTDGPVTQSIFDTDLGRFGAGTYDIDWSGNDDATHIYYSSSLTSSILPIIDTQYLSSEVIFDFPAFPAESDFPITYTDSYTICAVSASDSSSLLQTIVSASADTTAAYFVGGLDRFEYNHLSQNASDFETFFNYYSAVNNVYVWAADEATPIFYNTVTEESSPYAQLSSIDPINVPEIVLESPWVINNDYDGTIQPFEFSSTNLTIQNSFIGIVGGVSTVGLQAIGNSYQNGIYNTTGGNGTGLTVSITVAGNSSAGEIISVVIVNSGSGYDVDDVVTVSGPGPGIQGQLKITAVSVTQTTSQYTPNITKLGQCIRFEEKCKERYPNVRIKWKNRFGQYDFLNFSMVSKEAFATTRKTYQPQVGSWNSSTLEYSQWESSIQNYVSDSTQTISVNSDWLSEDYNDLLKQLVSSDEIYWIYNDAGDIRPLAITTSNIRFKTGVVDKLIQYSFDFKYGQNYKLIL
tara:strand:+ start:995 stop:2833 length:1839 start_codon:yes stop_codon:yes gene_type:complete